ncbi:hypothetical protein EDD15DRAFT_2193599 [Pisolithus albus]|nr:hypothetical protein EDD15DRAFT_2193599 [Pisolithus albus]
MFPVHRSKPLQLPPLLANLTAGRSTGDSQDFQSSKRQCLEPPEQPEEDVIDPKGDSTKDQLHRGRYSRNAKGTVPIKPMLIAFYPPLWAKLLDLAKARMRLYVAVENAFPRLEDAVGGQCREVLMEVIAHFEAQGWEVEAGKATIRLTNSTCAGCDLKKVAIKSLRADYDLYPPTTAKTEEQRIAAVKKKADDLLNTARYLRGEPDGQFTEFQEYVPYRALALVAAMVHALLSSFRKHGIDNSAQVNSQDVDDAYTALNETILDVLDHPHHGPKLNAMLTDWAQSGMTGYVTKHKPTEPRIRALQGTVEGLPDPHPLLSTVQYCSNSVHCMELSNKLAHVLVRVALYSAVAALITLYGNVTGRDLSVTLSSLSLAVLKFNGERPADNIPPWMDKPYEYWFCGPLPLVENILSNSEFHGEFDYGPYQDFTTGNSIEEKDTIARDPSTHGATFVPIILGSDKTMVSVATSQNDYWPVYLSVGNIHNNVQCVHHNGVELLAFLAIPKVAKKYTDNPTFWCFKKQLFYIAMSKILDYLEQVLISGIVQKWCGRCTASPNDLDAGGPTCMAQLMRALIEELQASATWDEWGIDAIEHCDFPHADIYQLLELDILHQLIKGGFKDHLVEWVGKYLELVYRKAGAKERLADIDRHIAAAPPFPGLWRFPDGWGFSQWTGDDSKALMKVSLLFPSLPYLILGTLWCIFLPLRGMFQPRSCRRFTLSWSFATSFDRMSSPKTPSVTSRWLWTTFISIVKFSRMLVCTLMDSPSLINILSSIMVP